MKFAFSIGWGKFDNRPAQLEAEGVPGFLRAAAAPESPAKGGGYLCGPMAHRVSERYPDQPAAHWRSAAGALPCAFVSFDFDAFASPLQFDVLRGFLQRWPAVLWQTHSSTPAAPRCRVIVALDRPLPRDARVRVTEILEDDIRAAIGPGANLDTGVRRPEQPLYCRPPHQQPEFFGIGGDA